jgi:4-amino-4-deoxy-L-arabinose transferase-like glycosyltransferase
MHQRLLTTARKAVAVLAHPSGGPFSVFALAFVLLWMTAAQAPPRNLAFFDQPFYVVTAWELLTYRVYGDGVFDTHDGAAGPPPPGIWLPPGWPFVLTGLMALDPALREAAECVVRARDPVGCPAYLGLVPPVQMAFVAGALALFFAASRRLVTVPVAALATLICLVLLWRYVGVLRLAMTESLALFLFSLVAQCLVRALRGSLGFALLCGGALALLTLTRPSHILLIPFCGLVLLAVLRATRRGQLAAMLLAVGATLVLVPWAARNHAQTGKFALSGGYGAAIYTERLAWNEMTGRELLMSFVYNLPDAGNGLAEKLFGRSAVQRLDWNLPESFYAKGQADRMAMLGMPGDPPTLRTLLASQTAAEWVWHSLTTVSLAWRGLWIGRSLGLIMLPLMLIGLFVVLGHPARLLIVLWLLPAWLMLGAHAALSVNQERYNLALAFPWAFCAAIGAAWLTQRLASRRGKIQIMNT